MFFLSGQRALVLCLAMLAGVNASSDSYTGPELSYSAFDGECVDSDFSTKGATTAVSKIAGSDGSGCETDVLQSPNGTLTTVYTKFVEVSCASDKINLEFYDCSDASCSVCEETPESAGFMEVKNLQESYSNVETCSKVYAENGTTMEFDLQSLSASRFDSSTNVSNVQEYYKVFFGITCGDAWLNEYIIQANSGPSEAIGGPDEDGCIPGEDWCPEIDSCIMGFKETCPLSGGEPFLGGATLTCDGGRCATDTLCEWSDGSAQYATYYWTNLNGTNTLPGGCEGITCVGCLSSDAAPNAETEMNTEMDADMDTEDNAEMTTEMKDDMDGNNDGNAEGAPNSVAADNTSAGSMVQALKITIEVCSVVGAMLFI